MKKYLLMALLPLSLACVPQASTKTAASYQQSSASPYAAGIVGADSEYGGEGEQNASEPATTAAPATPTTPAPPPADPKARLVIFNASLGLAVKDVKSSVAQVEEISKKYGGFTVNSRKSGQDTYFSPDHASLGIRIPSESLEKALEEISALGRVKSRSISGQDVTAEFQDLQLRLDSKEKLLLKLRELLAKAENTGTALEVEKEINRVTLELEQIKGQLLYYKDQLALSTVSIEIEKRHIPGPLGAVGYGIIWVVGKLFVLD